MSNRSAFEAIPGRDALVEYIPSVSYPVKSYVEKDGLIFKSLTATTTGFTSSQWELVADLREVRVANIMDRNALTGNTPTSGTTGIRIPILDNTNVLVLNAAGDPQVNSNQFARYNYNQGNASWLLLQVGTGSTSASTTVYYYDVLSKPSIVSGVTVNAGNGLSGGGSVFGTNIAPYAAGGSITISHADTSSLANINNSGYAYVQKLNFDTYGHVTGATSSTWVHPSGLTQNVINTGRTYIQSISINNGHVTSVSSSPWIHPDTSSQANSVNAGNTYIQSIYLDGDGHVTGINTGTVSVGGSGYSVKVNGDSGGALTVASGGTITVSGGTNISTVRTGNANNAGVRINFNPAGANGQLQLNNGGFLGASTNLTFLSNILTTPSINLSSVPSVGTLSDNILVRNTGSGLVQTIPTSSIGTANNGLNKIGNNYRLGGALTGDTTISGSFNINFTNNSWTFGTRTGSTTINSMSIGLNNSSIGGSGSLAVGQNNRATGQRSIAFGFAAYSLGDISFAMGNNVTANNTYAFAGGYGQSQTIPIIAGGVSSFNYSYNDGSQTVGHGALAAQSVILGGKNHNIDAGSINSAIIGGDAIKLGAGYSNHVAVPNLAIWTTPVAGAAVTDDVLVWNATDKKVKKVTQASLAGAGSTPAGSNTQIQINNSGAFGASPNLTYSTGSNTLSTINLTLAGSLTLSAIPSVGTLSDNILIRNTGSGLVQTIPTNSIVTANNGLNKTGINIRLGGALTGDTTISGAYNINFSNTSWTFGSRSGTTGTNSFTSGISNLASGAYSASFGQQSKSTGSVSFSAGAFTNASGAQSTAFGWGGNATGMGSFASGFGNGAGKGVTASGIASFNHSFNHNISQVAGHGALANYSAILGGQDHNIEASNTHAAIIGGNGIKLTGSTFSNTVAVPALAIMSTPPVGSGDNRILTWNGAANSKKISSSSSFYLNSTTNSLTLGSRTGTTGLITTTIGINNSATSNYCLVVGEQNVVTLSHSMAMGRDNRVSTQYSVALGSLAYATGIVSNAIGFQVTASGSYSSSSGYFTSASGYGSFAGGVGAGSPNKRIFATATSAFNFSQNSVSQVDGHGARANGCAILGGRDHDIDVGNSNSAIIGGQGIKLTTGYADHVALPYLALFSTPPAGLGTDDVLVWNSTDKKVKKVTQASISDERLKKNLSPLENVLNNIDTLSTVEFQYNEKNQPEMIDTFDYGLIAQEVEKVYPNVVKDNLTIDGDEENYKTIEYRKLVPVLFAAIKELNNKIKELESKIK